MSPIPKPAYRSFAVGELGFFWRLRDWPEIDARFGEDRTGSSDIRDAIIEVDDEGGAGFLHWYADRGSWGLTDAGKRWVERLVSSRALAQERDWVAPAEALAKAADSQRRARLSIEIEEENAPRAERREPAAESEAEELSRLVDEQSEDAKD